MTIKNGAQIMIDSLLEQGVKEVFGYPGGSIITFYDELYKNSDKITHYLARHEQGAIHAAEGYAKSTGKVGVAIFTSGPGATNAVTGIADAYLDNIPIVCICGQVKSTLIGTNSFQEVDTNGITRSISKYNYLVKDINDIDRVIKEAFYIAKSGKPGPVVISVTSDVQAQKIEYVPPNKPIRKLHYEKTKNIDECVDKIVEMFKEAKKPVVYFGGGVLISGKKAVKQLNDFIINNNLPAVSSFMGLGSFPSEDKRFLGMIGMHGSYEANLTVYNSDLLIVIGSRMTDRATVNVDTFSKQSKKIHIDIESANINLNVSVELGIIGDIGEVLKKLNKKLSGNFKFNEWWSEIENWKLFNSPKYINSNKTIKPQYLIERISDLTKDKKNIFIATDVGQHQMWTAQFYKFSRPRQFISSGGLGTMGFGLPAAIGVQIANPKSKVICISGDGSIMMNIQELATAIYYNLPVKIVIVNNGVLGMVRQWQKLLFERRFSNTTFEKQSNFVAIAKAFGCKSATISSPDEIDGAIAKMIKSKKPYVLNVVVDDENVVPMVPSGKSFTDMLLTEDFKKYEE
jgi:acetolactate synthase-1/2/3 large subunit